MQKELNSTKDKNDNDPKDTLVSDDFDNRWDAKFSKYAKGGILSAEEFDKMMQEMIDFE